MKRSIHLQHLSRQHHNGLLAALLISKGLKKNADLPVIGDFILHNWKQDLHGHFKQEEEILLPALQGKAFDTSLTKQLLNEHRQLRAIVTRIQQGDINKEDIASFSLMLEQHIRFEERIYFPAVEKTLGDDEMKKIGEQLTGDDQAFNCSYYPVKFWE